MKTKERQQKREEVQEGEVERAQWRESKAEGEKKNLELERKKQTEKKHNQVELKSFIKTPENVGR